MTVSDRKVQNYASWPHILIVDDDKRIRELVSRYLSAQNFIVLSAEDAAQADAVLEHFDVDVVILDVMMPGETGLSLAARWRAAGQDVPVLMLTALGEADDRIAGLEAGVDDYLPKPFEPRELVLRLNVILKRAVKKVRVHNLWRLGEWIYDPAQDELNAGDKSLRLTSAESALLKALLDKPHEVLSREELAAACGLDAGERTIDVQVTRLRRKIETDTKSPRILMTVRGKGYRLHAELVEG